MPRRYPLVRTQICPSGSSGSSHSGHVLAGADGQVYGVDHGVSLHAEDKLRTVLWGWAGKPIDDDVLGAVAALRDALRDGL